MKHLLRWCYSIIFWLIVPFLVGHLLWKSRNNPDYRYRWRERFGYPKGIQHWSSHGILLHAVSVGELNAARPVLESLLVNYPHLAITITTTTPTASHQVQQWFRHRVQHAYLPFDLPHTMARFLDKLKPRLVLVMETEIWPNLFFISHQKNAQLVMLNARLSPRTARHYRWLSGLVRPTLQKVDWIGAQSTADARRLVIHGANPNAVHVTGNLKFNVQPSEQDWRRARTLKQQLQHRLVLIAGSTHDGEESILIKQFIQLQLLFPKLLLVLAPRHPDRAEKVYALCRQQNLETVRYTHSKPIDNQAQIIILDVIGQLLSWYGAADVTFMGGTLVPIGGHNPIEPAVMGCAVVIGPYRESILDTAQQLSDANAAITVDSETELAASLHRLLNDAALRTQIGDSAQEWVMNKSGGLQKTLSQLAKFLTIDSPE